MEKVTDRTFYRIKNAAGLYSAGTSYPRFTRQGKRWESLAALKNHLHIVKATGHYDGCVLETIQVTETISGTIPVPQYLKDIMAQAAEAQQAQRERWAAADRQREIDMLTRLKIKYEPGNA